MPLQGLHHSDPLGRRYARSASPDTGPWTQRRSAWGGHSVVGNGLHPRSPAGLPFRTRACGGLAPQGGAMNRKQMYLAVAGLLAGTAHAQKTDLVAEEVVVTATRFDDVSVDKPVSITTISSDDIRRSPARTVPELLSYQAGIGGRDLFGNNAAQATIDMRGFGATAAQNTLVLLDG